MQGTEERIRGLKDVTDRTMGITQSGHRRENRLGKEKKKKRTFSGICGTIIKDLTFMQLHFWKETRKRVGMKRYLKK